MGRTSFERLTVPIGGGAALAVGAFIEALINFVLIALALFLMVRIFTRLARRRREEEKKVSENPELKVLMEIRDTLRKR